MIRERVKYVRFVSTEKYLKEAERRGRGVFVDEYFISLGIDNIATGGKTIWIMDNRIKNKGVTNDSRKPDRVYGKHFFTEGGEVQD